LGEDFRVDRLGIAPGALDDPSFELLAALGFARAELDTANSFCCGAMTLEGAPYLKPETSGGVRVRQPVWPHWQARSVG
jgi:ribonucleoside-diphosphate reductase alpha chain